MADASKCFKCFTVAKSWMGKPFELLVKLYNQSEAFREEWDAALAQFDALVKRPFDIPASVHAHKCTKQTMSRMYWFLTVNQFIKRFSYEPKVLGSRVHNLTDEFGSNKDVRGVIIRPDPVTDSDSATYRQVTFSHETTLFVDETLRSEQERLRRNEPMDCFRMLAHRQASERKDRFTFDASIASLAFVRMD
jgi:hypothetical protein